MSDVEIACQRMYGVTMQCQQTADSSTKHQNHAQYQSSIAACVVVQPAALFDRIGADDALGYACTCFGDLFCGGLLNS